ncbi:MAG: SRPBCC family protein [Burkholderiaceae bacterium]
MLKIITLIIALLVVGVLFYASTRPNSFRIERSITIAAPADRIFPLVNDFHQWEAWSPWEKVDPALKRTYSGSGAGKGAAYGWEGNKEVGSGTMEITESIPHSRVVINLHFLKPFEARNTVEFVLQPQVGGTLVTQAMYGPSPLMSKIMGLVFSMDKMVGSKYEEGLASIKGLAEK